MDLNKLMKKVFMNEEEIKKEVEKLNKFLKEKKKLTVVVRYNYNSKRDVYTAKIKIYSNFFVDYEYRNNKEVYYINLDNGRIYSVTPYLFNNSNAENRWN